jgi:AcrR family transcriptional regulator
MRRFPWDEEVKASGQNKVGQVMRSKGLRTRRRIIDQTIALLRDTPGGRVSSADVARAAGLTPPALYLYFEGVPEVMLARLEEIRQAHNDYIDLLDKPWSSDSLLQDATHFLSAYSEYWRTNYTVLHYRNVMSDQGDTRFMLMRVEMTRPLAEHLKARMVKARRRGDLPRQVDSGSAAAAALALIDHMMSTISSPYGSWGTVTWTKKGLINAIAVMLTSMIKGDDVPVLPVVAEPIPAKANSRRARAKPSAEKP